MKDLSWQENQFLSGKPSWMVKKSCYMFVREEKYVAWLSKFPCLWEITELNQGGCDNDNGQQGSSCDCKTHVKAPLQLLAAKSEMLRETLDY